jgi:hypothetical protein
MMTQTARWGADIDKDNSAAVFYVHVSPEMSLPDRFASKSYTLREDERA